jgi:hypothetical protein
MKPIVVSNNGNTHDLAVKALNKLKHPLTAHLAV